MKSLILILSLFFTVQAFSQTQGEVQDASISNPEKKSKFIDNISLQFETEFATIRNDEQSYAISGHSQYYRLEIAAKLPYELRLQVGGDYVERDYNEDEEAKRRDHLDNVFLKLRHGTARYRDNGIADVRLQYRYYYTTDEFFRDRFGSDSNYQLRAYLGRPIVGNFHLSKYNSYLRYKKYQLNENASSRSREYEYRVRISPVYRPDIDHEFGVTTTYNKIIEKGGDEVSWDLGISARKQFGRYAILFFTSSDLFVEDDKGNLETNKDFWNDTTFFLNFNAIIF